ncbi:MAG: DNA primase [Elusimicrobia bacterium GWA2_61_42]|nr:MAG: DNA primase [Elusimicrobia bacterium GWA2_61_42]OGR78074.1 MAG: DNA primase [Elusimicrobia bacterium GWC2_61_25]
MSSSPIIELIREKLDIVDVIREYVPALKKAGRNHKANCPFHNEKSPSFTVSPDKQIFYCFGCNEGGDIFTFVMKIEGLTFPEAARKLALKAGVEYGEDRSHAMTEADKERLEIKKLLTAAAAFYHAALFSPAGEKARLYLGERRLSKATVERFELGWAPAGGAALMDEMKAKGWSRDIALKAGLITEREGGLVADTFRGRIMFPIRNQTGDTVAFGGRVLDPEAQPKYLNSPETILFSKRRTLYGLHEALPQIRKSAKLLLLEGYMDVIGAHQHGVDWAVAPLGTALTNEHAGLIGRYAKDTVVMFDGDRAGINASVRAAEIFMEAGLYVRLADLGCPLDPDEFLNDYGREEFEKKIAEASDPLDFRMNLFFKGRKTPPSSQEKAQAIAVLLETVAKQPDEILKSEWVKSLASRFSVEEASVLKQLRKVSVQAPREVKRGDPEAVKAIPSIERGFIQLLLRDPALIEKAAGLEPEDFSNPMARDFFAAMRDMAPAERAKAATSLAARFPDQAPLIMGLAVADLGGDSSAAQNAAGAMRMLKRFSLERRLKELKAAEPMDEQQFKEYSRIMSELKSSVKEL